MKIDVGAVINSIAALISAMTAAYLAYKGTKQKNNKKEREP